MVLRDKVFNVQAVDRDELILNISMFWSVEEVACNQTLMATKAVSPT